MMTGYPNISKAGNNNLSSSLPAMPRYVTPYTNGSIGISTSQIRASTAQQHQRMGQVQMSSSPQPPRVRLLLSSTFYLFIVPALKLVPYIHVYRLLLKGVQVATASHSNRDSHGTDEFAISSFEKNMVTAPLLL